MSPEELQRKRDEQILSRIHEGLNNLQVRFEFKMPIRRPDQDGANVNIDGSLSYTDEPLAVKGEDRREKVNSPEDWPFCVHGRFTVQLPEGTLVGSGTMIGHFPGTNMCA